MSVTSLAHQVDIVQGNLRHRITIHISIRNVKANPIDAAATASSCAIANDGTHIG